MSRSSLYLALLIASSTCGLASSVTQANDIGAGLKVGTNGVALELTFNLIGNINLRGGYSDLTYGDDVEDTDVTYDADLDMQGVFLFADWHPLDTSFRVSAGLYNYFDNEVTGDADPVAGTFTINGVTYSSSDLASLDAEIEFETVAPYVGIGWGNAVGDGDWSFSFDLGVLYIGDPDVKVNYSCTNPALCSAIDDDIQTEINELEDDVDDYEWWPVLNIGMAYKF